MILIVKRLQLHARYDEIRYKLSESSLGFGDSKDPEASKSLTALMPSMWKIVRRLPQKHDKPVNEKVCQLVRKAKPLKKAQTDFRVLYDPCNSQSIVW